MAGRLRCVLMIPMLGLDRDTIAANGSHAEVRQWSQNLSCRVNRRGETLTLFGQRKHCSELSGKLRFWDKSCNCERIIGVVRKVNTCIASFDIYHNKKSRLSYLKVAATSCVFRVKLVVALGILQLAV
jgi:hypothetical protein